MSISTASGSISKRPGKDKRLDPRANRNLIRPAISWRRSRSEGTTSRTTSIAIVYTDSSPLEQPADVEASRGSRGRRRVSGELRSPHRRCSWLLAAFTFAIYTVAGKQIRGRYDGLTMTTLAYASSAAVLSPITLWLAANFDFTKVTWAGWVSIVYIATFPSVIAYLIFYHALRFMPSTQLSRLTYLQPFIATAVAVPLLGEKVTASLVTGGALVLAGVFVTERQ